MVITRDRGGPSIELEHSLPSEVAAISPFVDRLMLLLKKCGCVAEGESDVEITLREALANAIIHGNLENPRKHVHVRCRCKSDEVSIAVTDEGRGFDFNKMPDPTAPPNICSAHGRGIYLMKTLTAPKWRGLLYLLQVVAARKKRIRRAFFSPAVGRSEKELCVNGGISIDKPSSPFFWGCDGGLHLLHAPGYFFAYTAEI